VLLKHLVTENDLGVNRHKNFYSGKVVVVLYQI